MVVTKVEPRTAEELAGALRDAAQAKQTVVPVGGGRSPGFGAPGDVEIHTTRLDRVIEHSQADMVVSVEAGITLEALEAELAKAGQFLPVDPFNAPGHTVGGILASGWTGPLRMRFGSPRDFLIGIRVALPDGKLATGGGRVVKNVSGYDMMKLHYGAFGSLGIIVAASFKVFPLPLRDVTLTSDGGWDDAEVALGSAMPPSALEVFSDGRVLARYMGSSDAVDRIARELGWHVEDTSIWERHARRAPARWARISAPRSELIELMDELPQGAGWWASPGIGVAHWAIASDAQSVRDLRAKVEAAGGTLVMMGGPDDFVAEVGAWGTPPPTLELMQRLKRAFDPDAVLNPGSFVV